MKIQKRTIKSLHEINYPAFKIEQEPFFIDGLVFLNGRVIDDQNVSRETLGERRLLTSHDLGPLRKTRWDLIDIVKDQGPDLWYIDNLGSVINYRRTTYENLVCHAIKDVIYRDTYSLILLDGINFPIVVKRPPVGSYGQMLYYRGLPWKLYRILPEAVKTTRKKV